MSDSYYEDILIPNEGIAVKMGVSNSFQDDFCYVSHIYDYVKSEPPTVEASGSRLILIHSLVKRVVEPIDAYLDIYGSILIDIDDLNPVIDAIEEVANNLKCGVFHKPYIGSDSSVPQLDRKLLVNGGKIIYGKHRSFKYENQDIPFDQITHEPAFHIHEFYDRYSDEYNILIVGYSRSNPKDDFDAHDYDSVFIRLGYEDKFINALEQMRDRIESSSSLSQNS